MAHLQLRGKRYYIVFSKRIEGKMYQKKFSLHTGNKRIAAKKVLEYEELFEQTKIDPFNGWDPKSFEKEKAGLKAKPKYITLEDLSREFIEKRNQVSSITKGNYEYVIAQLKKQVGYSLPVHMISEDDIRKCCFKHNLKPASQANYLRHLKVFFAWLKSQGYVKKDVTSDIKKPKINKNVSEKTISEEQLYKVFSAYRADITSKKKKNLLNRIQSRVWFRPVVMTAFYGGLRVKEIVNLKWENIRLDLRLLTVTDTKSGEERTIPLQSKLLSILKAWHRFNNLPDKGLIFPTTKKGVESMKMSKQNVSRVFKQYVKKVGLPEGINFHGLRHSCGTELLRMGYDINEVAKILGHSSLDVTKVYEHLTPNDLSDKMQKIEGHEGLQEKEKRKLKEKEEELKKMEEMLKAKELELEKREAKLKKK